NRARNPEVLWRALTLLNPTENMPRLRIHFTGNVDPSVLAAAARAGVEDLIDVKPYVPHGAAIDRIRSSTLLLLCINRVEGSSGITPREGYEYAGAGRRVWGAGPPAGGAAGVLGATDAGRMFVLDGVDGVMAPLRAAYRAWDGGKRLPGASPERGVPYSRRHQT